MGCHLWGREGKGVDTDHRPLVASNQSSVWGSGPGELREGRAKALLSGDPGEPDLFLFWPSLVYSLKSESAPEVWTSVFSPVMQR